MADAQPRPPGAGADAEGRPQGPASGGRREVVATEEEAVLTFEELMAELEAVTDALATGDLGIEAAADLYERAERLHALAAGRLAQVQGRVERLRSGRDG